ncbi:hypothetical protein OsJ_21637 [Oryza sativa Japonica Group]|nr:hypothetical protein OsJ_21637 [Oryza sativa Japonica Group]
MPACSREAASASASLRRRGFPRFQHHVQGLPRLRLREVLPWPRTILPNSAMTLDTRGLMRATFRCITSVSASRPRMTPPPGPPLRSRSVAAISRCGTALAAGEAPAPVTRSSAASADRAWHRYLAAPAPRWGPTCIRAEVATSTTEVPRKRPRARRVRCRLRRRGQCNWRRQRSSMWRAG